MITGGRWTATTTEWTAFGAPDLFEVAVQARRLRAPQPASEGLRLVDWRSEVTIARQQLTSHQRGAAKQAYVS